MLNSGVRDLICSSGVGFLLFGKFQRETKESLHWVALLVPLQKDGTVQRWKMSALVLLLQTDGVVERWKMLVVVVHLQAHVVVPKWKM